MANLVGIKLPDVELAATDGTSVNLSKLNGTSVVFCYPFTGRPNHPNPPDWDNIPGAHGSTPQALAFSALYHEFKILNVNVFGLSCLTTEWQRDFASRNALPFLLLSDESQRFSSALQLRTFSAGHNSYLSRRSLIVQNGTIRHDVDAIPQPELNAAEMLALLNA